MSACVRVVVAQDRDPMEHESMNKQGGGGGGLINSRTPLVSLSFIQINPLTFELFFKGTLTHT